MNKLAEQRRGDCYITRGVDYGEKTLDTTVGNECKFSWDRQSEEKNVTDKNQFLKKKVSYMETDFV